MTSDQPVPPSDDANGGDETPDDETSDGGSLLERLSGREIAMMAISLALIFSVGFIWLTAQTFDSAGSDTEEDWLRHLYVFQTMFALVSAIIGAVFTATVYRPQVKRARGDAQKAQRDVQKNAKEAGAAAGAAREHGERREAETREKILADAVRRAQGRRLQAIDVNQNRLIDDPSRLRGIVEQAAKSNDVHYFQRSPDDNPPDILTLDDLVAAVESSRE